jgi:hypothetical protein
MEKRDWESIFIYDEAKNKIEVYFDKTSLYNIDNKFIKILTKWNGNGIKYIIIEDLVKNNFSIGNYKDFSYRLQWYYADCKLKTIGIKSWIDYDSENNVLNSFSSETPKLEIITANSIEEDLYNLICRNY